MLSLRKDQDSFNQTPKFPFAVATVIVERSTPGGHETGVGVGFGVGLGVGV